MGLVKGLLYCFLWYSSILAGYAGLFCPLLPLLFISNKLYRCCTDALFTFWQYYPTVLLETLCGCDIQVSGDVILTGETSLIVMNHRTRTDWNFLWPTMYHCVYGKYRFMHPTKFVLKDVIRHIPGPGWVMQLSCFLFVRRRRHQDRPVLRAAVDYLADLRRGFSLLVFPEGTDLTAATRAKSDAFAARRRLPPYAHVLHPRTTGFAWLAGRLLERAALDAVYDVTLVYADAVPQAEGALLRGRFPREVKVHLARYPATVLPKTEEGLKDFLEKRWQDKERTLKEYHATGQFLHGNILKTNKPIELLAALIFWSLLPIFVLYLFYVHQWFRFLVIGHTVFLILLNFVSDGFQIFEIGLYNFKKKIFGFFFKLA